MESRKKTESLRRGLEGEQKDSFTLLSEKSYARKERTHLIDIEIASILVLRC
jgi:hypothetical protein